MVLYAPAEALYSLWTGSWLAYCSALRGHSLPTLTNIWPTVQHADTPMPHSATPHSAHTLDKLISRAPSVSCATRLMLSICLFIFYPGISSEPLNLSQQKFARWRQLVRNRIWWVWIFEFFRGVRLGAKNVTFCPDLPGVTFTKYNMAPKRKTISKIENCPVLAR